MITGELTSSCSQYYFTLSFNLYPFSVLDIIMFFSIVIFKKLVSVFILIK